jgi:TonB family protein
VNLARATVTYGVCILALAASLPTNAQQAQPPVSIGSPDLSLLHFASYVQPEYAQIALFAQVSGEVVLDARLGVDGTVDDIRVVQSIPLLDQAAVDAVRRWRFERPSVPGQPDSIRIPISVTFARHGGSVLVPVSKVRSTRLPRDFAVVFASNCPNGGGLAFNTATQVYERVSGPVSVRVQLLTLTAADLETIHDLIVKVGLISDASRLVQWPDAPPAPRVSDAGIRVSVPAPGFIPSGPFPHELVLEMRMNGTWTRLFPPATWQRLLPPHPMEARDRELQRGAQEVSRWLQQRIGSFEFVRRLPRDQRWCQWPD